MNGAATAKRRAAQAVKDEDERKKPVIMPDGKVLALRPIAERIALQPTDGPARPPGKGKRKKHRRVRLRRRKQLAKGAAAGHAAKPSVTTARKLSAK